MTYPRACLKIGPRSFAWLLLLASLLCAPGSADTFRWKSPSNRVDANIESWPLPLLLGKISAATGWQTYLEPGPHKPVSAKFANLPSGDALRRLLGDLNYAVIPQRQGPSKLLVFKTSLTDATELIPTAPDASADAPKNTLLRRELILTLKPGSKESAEEIAKRLGGKVVGAIDGLNAYRLEFDAEDAANAARSSLANNENVQDLDSNYRLPAPGQSEAPPGTSPPPFNLRPKVSTDQTQTIVGLIDTAVQPLPGLMKDFVLPSLQVSGEPGRLNGLSHGTSMAETILQGLSLASQEQGGSSVRILPVDVYGPYPETTTFEVAKGVFAAVNAGATVINLSMGGEGNSEFLSNVIRDTHKQGVLYFGAAGNEPTGAPTYPAAYPEVVAVTAGDKKGNLAPYANYGSFVDVIAPGVSMVQFNGETYAVSGTSTSTAYVSGTAAALRAAGKPAPQVEAAIRAGAPPKP